MTTEIGQAKKPTKTSAAILSILSNSLLILLKVVAGVVTGSVSVLAEAIHSALDLVAAVIASSVLGCRTNRLMLDILLATAR